MPPAASQGGALPPPGPVKGAAMNLAHSSGLRCVPRPPVFAVAIFGSLPPLRLLSFPPAIPPDPTPHPNSSPQRQGRGRHGCRPQRPRPHLLRRRVHRRVRPPRQDRRPILPPRARRRHHVLGRLPVRHPHRDGARRRERGRGAVGRHHREGEVQAVGARRRRRVPRVLPGRQAADLVRHPRGWKDLRVGHRDGLHRRQRRARAA